MREAGSAKEGRLGTRVRVSRPTVAESRFGREAGYAHSMGRISSQGLRWTVAVGTFSTALFFTACGKSDPPSAERPENVSFEPENFEKLSKGMSEQRVVELLGEPEAKTKNSFRGVDLIYSADNRVFDVLVDEGGVASLNSSSCNKKLFTDPDAAAVLGDEFEALIQACQ